ncbi:MAG TPA: substrate-binding domain-containing protein [Pirellulales bacterium]|nr:substrate-binding domain-containing protein [Pirellulales bacterium]
MKKLFPLLACIILAAGCGAEAPSGGSGPRTGLLRIAVIPKGTTHEFWRSVHAGAEKAAQELGGVEVIWKGPLQESDREGQISLVQDFVTSRVDGICLAPLDSQALVAAVRSAKAEGIPTVIFDSALADETDIVSYVATDNFRCGELAAQTMAKMLEGRPHPKVILLRYNPGSESTEQREEGFLKGLKPFPNVEILSSDQFSGTSFEDSLSVSQQMLLKYGDQVDGIFTVCEPNSTGMLGALQGHAELAGKVKFIAFDPNARLIQAMREGTVSGIVLQDPIKMGYLGVKTLVEHVRGKSVEKRVSTGEFIATPENMDQPEMAALLAPEKSAN